MTGLTGSSGSFYHRGYREILEFSVYRILSPGIVKDWIFHEQQKISSQEIYRLFRARLLDVLQAETIYLGKFDNIPSVESYVIDTIYPD